MSLFLRGWHTSEILLCPLSGMQKPCWFLCVKVLVDLHYIVNRSLNFIFRLMCISKKYKIYKVFCIDEKFLKTLVKKIKVLQDTMYQRIALHDSYKIVELLRIFYITIVSSYLRFIISRDGMFPLNVSMCLKDKKIYLLHILGISYNTKLFDWEQTHLGCD